MVSNVPQVFLFNISCVDPPHCYPTRSLHCVVFIVNNSVQYKCYMPAAANLLKYNHINKCDRKYIDGMIKYFQIGYYIAVIQFVYIAHMMWLLL